MSLFSFFRRDKTAQDNNRAVGRNASPASEKQGRRSRGAVEEVDSQLPEKQRARRRLIGSIVLVIAALIVLPLVFESKPQKPNLNVALQVDSKVSSSAAQPEPQPAPADQNAQPPSDQQAAPQNAGVAAPEPVTEPVKEAAPDRSAEKARAEADREKADRERAEKDRKAKAEREKADRERAAREKADREKADRERAEKERRAQREREKANRERAAKEKAAARKKSSGGDPIGQMIDRRTKRR